MMRWRAWCLVGLASAMVACGSEGGAQHGPADAAPDVDSSTTHPSPDSSTYVDGGNARDASEAAAPLHDATDAPTADAPGDGALADAGGSDALVDAKLPDAPADGAPLDGAEEGGGPNGTCEAPLPLAALNGADTTAFPNLLGSTCSSTFGSGTEIVYQVTAVEDGRIELELDSLVDLGLSVRHACETAPSEIACEDQVPGGAESLSVPIESNEALFVIVEGWSTSHAGVFSLSSVFEPASCGDGALDGNEQCDDGDYDDLDGCSETCALESCESPLVLESAVSGDTTSSHSVVDASCANDESGPEDIYGFIAPTAGTYRFTLTPTGGADLVLALRSICADETTEACSDEGFDGGPEGLQASLAQGEAVFVIVDGWGTPDVGAYTLEVDAGD